MHPLVLPTAARHRRELTTRQFARFALAILGTIAVVATVGVFGGSVAGGVPAQTRVLEWLAAHGISTALGGWALYAVPMGALSVILSRSLLLRIFGCLVLVPSLLAIAVMSRPRGLTVADWQQLLPASGSDFVHATRITAYVLLAGCALWALWSAFSFFLAMPARHLGAHRNHATADEVLNMVRRSASRAALLALAASLPAVLLTLP